MVYFGNSQYSPVREIEKGVEVSPCLRTAKRRKCKGRSAKTVRYGRRDPREIRSYGSGPAWTFSGTMESWL